MKKWLVTGAFVFLLSGCGTDNLIQNQSYALNVYGKGATLTEEEIKIYSPWKQTIMYQKDRYIQTKNTYGKHAETNRVWYQNKTGLYEVSFSNNEGEWESESFTKKNVISEVKKNKKRLLWRFDAKKGDVWKSAGATFRVVREGYKLDGVYDSFKNVTVIDRTENDFTVRLYFHPSKGMVKMETPLFNYDIQEEQ